MKTSTRLDPTEFIINSIPHSEVDSIIDRLGHHDSKSFAHNPLIARLVSKEDAHYIGCLDGNPNGIGYIHVYFPVHDDILWIQTFMINESYTRKGFGTAFFDQIIERLTKTTSINTLYLSCHESNIGGVLFWESLGFKKSTNLTKLVITTNEHAQVIIYEKKCTHQ